MESTLSKISHPLSDSKESSTSGSDVTGTYIVVYIHVCASHTPLTFLILLIKEAESVKDLTIGHGKIAKNGKTVC